MADGDIKIKDLSAALQIDDSAEFVYTQDNGGTNTTFKAPVNQIARKIAESITYTNLGTTAKTLVGAINELLSLGSPIIIGTTAPTSSVGANGNIYIQYTEGTGGASDIVDALYVKLDGAWCEIQTGGGHDTTYTLGVDGNNVTLTPSSGTVQSITVPYAEKSDSLETSVKTVGNKIPYNFRTTNGGYVSPIGDRKTDMLVGGTLAFIQLAQFLQNQIPSNNNGIAYAYTDGTSVKCNGTATADETRSGWFGLSESSAFKNNDGHIVLISTFKVSGTASGDVYFGWGTVPNKIGASIITTVPSGTQRRFYYRIPNGTTCNDYIFTINVFDLTAMFGATIADYLYSLELSTAGSGVAFFRSLFPKPYYAYNAGELMSVKTSAHKTVGFNAWDEDWELGIINSTTGQNESNNSYIRAKNYISVLPNTSYYGKTSVPLRLVFYAIDKSFISIANVNNNAFTTPDNCYFVRFYPNSSSYGTTYKNDICINISGSKNGEYEPYEEHVYALDSDLELRGISKLDANNKLYYDGDTYESDGTVTRKYGIVNLGSLEWTYYTSGTNPIFYTTESLLNGKIYLANDYTYSIVSKDYTPIRQATSCSNLASILNDKEYGFMQNNGIVVFRDSAYTDKDTFKTAMNGVYLVYELATPTTETADTFTNPQIVNDFGTEEYVDTRAVPIPVGHETTYYFYNDKEKLDSLPDSAIADGDFIIKQADGKMTLSPYSASTPLHNYSTDEQIVGTWIDGSTIYEKTVNFSEALVCDANAWTNTPIPNSNISKIIDAACLNNGGTIFYCIGVNRDNASGYVQILNTRNSILSVDTIILRYTKSSS